MQRILAKLQALFARICRRILLLIVKQSPCLSYSSAKVRPRRLPNSWWSILSITPLTVRNTPRPFPSIIRGARNIRLSTRLHSAVSQPGARGRARERIVAANGRDWDKSRQGNS